MIKKGLRKYIITIILLVVFSTNTFAAEIARQLWLYEDDSKPVGVTNYLENFYLAAETDHMVVFTKDDYELMPNVLTKLNRVIARVEPMWLDMVSKFGPTTDVNQDGKYAIVFHDLPGSINGLFREANINPAPNYNFLDMIEINDRWIDEGDWSDDYAVSVIMHEAQHAIFSNNAPYDSTFLNEGLSVLAEELYVPNFKINYYYDQYFAYMTIGRKINYHNYLSNMVMFKYLYDFGGLDLIKSVFSNPLDDLDSIMNSMGLDYNSPTDQKKFFTDFMQWTLGLEKLYDVAQRPMPAASLSASGIAVERYMPIVRWLKPGRIQMTLTLDSPLDDKISYVVKELSFTTIRSFNQDFAATVASYSLEEGTHNITMSNKNNVLVVTPIYYAEGDPTTWSYNLLVQNVMPVAVDDTYSVDKNNTLIGDSVLVNDSDAEDVTVVTATLVDNVTSGALTFHTDGTFEYIPNDDFTGMDTFTYNARDLENGISNVAIVSISVMGDPVDQAPVITLNGGDITLTVGDTYTELGAIGNDLEDGSLIPEVNGAVDTAAPGSYTLTYKVTDTEGQTSSATRTVTVNNVPIVVVTPPAPSTGGSNFSMPAPIVVAPKTAEVQILGTKANVVADLVGTKATTTIKVEDIKTASTVKIESNLASVNIPKEVLVGMEKVKVEVTTTVSLSPKQKAVVGTATVYDFNMFSVDSNSKETKVSKFTQPITISVPYILRTGEKADRITMYYLDDDGLLVDMKGTYGNGKLTFTTTHFSYYVAMQTLVTFKDTTNPKIIELANKGIINGKAEGVYDPKGYLTRAELATLLVKALALDTDITKESFDDVKKTDWFYKEVMIAKASGIVNGTGDGKYNPNARVKYQDAIIMISRVMEKYKEATNTAPIKSYSGTSTYANGYVSHLVALGFITDSFKVGMTDINREEMAELVYKMVFYK